MINCMKNGSAPNRPNKYSSEAEAYSFRFTHGMLLSGKGGDIVNINHKLYWQEAYST